MNADQVKEHVRAVLAGIAPEADLDAIDAAAPVRDELDIDSMDFLRLMQGLSQRLGIDVPEADYPQLSTLTGMLAYLAQRAR